MGGSSHATLSSGSSIRIEELKVKDVVLLKAGATVPTDGKLLKAETFTVNEQLRWQKDAVHMQIYVIYHIIIHKILYTYIYISYDL